MSVTFKKFDLIAWSQSQGVTLRRLRAFAAPLGGRAHLVPDLETLMQTLGRILESPRQDLGPPQTNPRGDSGQGSDAPDPLVLIDHDLTLSPDQLQTLASRSRLVVMGDQHLPQAPHWRHPADTPGVKAWMRASGPLVKLLESPVARAALSWMAQSQETLTLDRFLRWGYNVGPWGSGGSAPGSPGPSPSPAIPLFAIASYGDGNSSLEILKKMGFRPKPSQAIAAILDQALTRLATAHIEVSPAKVASDGLTLGALAQITARGSETLENLAPTLVSGQDLKVITLRTSPTTWELVLVMPAPPFFRSDLGHETPLVILLQRPSQVSDLPLLLSTAG